MAVRKANLSDVGYCADNGCTRTNDRDINGTENDVRLCDHNKVWRFKMFSIGCDYWSRIEMNVDPQLHGDVVRVLAENGHHWSPTEPLAP